MKTGEPKGPAEKPLLMYPVKEEEGRVMVNLEKELEYDFDDEDD
jgi:nitrite reductase/ring-hydroxylating ferredoxin subunit